MSELGIRESEFKASGRKGKLLQVRLFSEVDPKNPQNRAITTPCSLNIPPPYMTVSSHERKHFSLILCFPLHNHLLVTPNGMELSKFLLWKYRFVEWNTCHFHVQRTH